MSFFYDLNARLAKLAAKQDAKQISEDAKAVAPKSKLAESLDVAEAGYSAKAGRAGKDLGKPGKNFSKIAKSAGARYGSKAAGERVAGAVLNKLRHPKESEMDESAFQAAIGKKKYGDEGMKALQKAGREHASKEKMANIRAKYDKYDESMGMTDEGNAFTGALKSTPKGGKFKVGGKEFTDTSSIEEVEMTPKQKSFAKLAPPVDKITFADKIAGAKQEVDEMLGDVAAEAMKSAVKKMGEADVTGLGEEEMDEGYAEMNAWLKSREKEKGTGRFDKRKVSTGTVYTRKPETFDDYDDEKSDAPKVKGRPKGSKRAIGAKGPTGKSKLMSKGAIKEVDIDPTDRGEYDREGDMAKDDIHTIVRHARALEKILGDNENLPEWVQSKLAKIQGMMVAVNDYMQTQHERGSEEVPEVAPPGAKAERMVKHIKKSLSKDGKLSDKDKAIAYATTWKAKKAGKVEEESTDKEDTRAEKAGKKVTKDIEYDEKHTGKDDARAEKAGKKVTKDIEYDDKKDKEEKVDETTTSGSVAAAPAAKSSKGMQFGKGVYENVNSQVENMIAEGMNVTVNMNSDAEGEAQKSITVTATGAEADMLAELLRMAGLKSSHKEVCPACGAADCGCEEELDENSPDWPTNKETLEAEPNLRTYSGGLNGPKSTGQTTTPVIASQLRRQASVEEGVKLERSLFQLYNNYKAK